MHPERLRERAARQIGGGFVSLDRTRRLPFLPRRHKYKVLLALLLASIVIQTYGLHSGVAGVLSDIFRSLLVMAVFLVVFRGTRERVPPAGAHAVAPIASDYLSLAGNRGAPNITLLSASASSRSIERGACR